MLDSDFNLDVENETESNLRGSIMDGYLYKVRNYFYILISHF